MIALYNALKERNLVFITNPPKGASYIMEDGKFLDLNNSADIVLSPECGNREFVTHPMLADYLVREGLLDEMCQKPLLDTDNAIAINDGTNYIREAAYICLPKEMPNGAQFGALLNWFTYLMTISPSVQIETKEKVPVKIYDFVSLESEYGWTPENIIKDIKRMYNQEETQ